MSNDVFVNNKEFDNLLAEARRFDGKSRRAQAEANGTLDVIAEAKKQLVELPIDRRPPPLRRQSGYNLNL